MSADIEFTELTHLDEDWAIPCEMKWEPCLNEAKWVMFRSPCCAEKPKAGFACEPCKERRLLNQISVECPFCGHVWPDSASAYTRIEPLT